MHCFCHIKQPFNLNIYGQVNSGCLSVLFLHTCNCLVYDERAKPLLSPTFDIQRDGEDLEWWTIFFLIFSPVHLQGKVIGSSFTSWSSSVHLNLTLVAMYMQYFLVTVSCIISDVLWKDIKIKRKITCFGILLVNNFFSFWE